MSGVTGMAKRFCLQNSDRLGATVLCVMQQYNVSFLLLCVKRIKKNKKPRECPEKMGNQGSLDWYKNDKSPIVGSNPLCLSTQALYQDHLPSSCHIKYCFKPPHRKVGESRFLRLYRSKLGVLPPPRSCTIQEALFPNNNISQCLSTNSTALSCAALRLVVEHP